MEEFNSNSFFGEKEAKISPLPETLQTRGAKKELNDGVCEVKFCTGGRLTAPPVLHFRDYNMRASQMLAEVPNSNRHVPIIVKILNSMVIEDFDCGLLHLEEIKEVLLNVHAKWWGGFLKGYKYLLDETLLDKEKLLGKENISEADIPISNLVVKPLDSKIKEPISIKVNDTTIRFVFPRARNAGIVEDLVKEKFAVEEQAFYSLQQKVIWNEKQTDPDLMKEIPLEEADRYRDYLARKAEYELACTRAQLICGIDEENFDTFEQRLEALLNDPRISVKHWYSFTTFLEEEGNFGVQDEVTFYSDILNTNVTRRFPFRSYSFFPTVQVDSAGIEQSEIHFG